MVASMPVKTTSGKLRLEQQTVAICFAIKTVSFLYLLSRDCTASSTSDLNILATMPSSLPFSQHCKKGIDHYEHYEPGDTCELCGKQYPLEGSGPSRPIRVDLDSPATNVSQWPWLWQSTVLNMSRRDQPASDRSRPLPSDRSRPPSSVIHLLLDSQSRLTRRELAFHNFRGQGSNITMRHPSTACKEQSLESRLVPMLDPTPFPLESSAASLAPQAMPTPAPTLSTNTTPSRPRSLTSRSRLRRLQRKASRTCSSTATAQSQSQTSSADSKRVTISPERPSSHRPFSSFS